MGGRNDDIDGSDGDEKEDDERHLRMLQGITGMSTDAFGGKNLSNLYGLISMDFTDQPSQ